MYSHRNWACPFFKWDECDKIHCEGGRLVFRSRESITDYADRYCGSVDGWQRCTIAASIETYYDRLHEDGVRKKRQA